LAPLETEVDDRQTLSTAGAKGRKDEMGSLEDASSQDKDELRDDAA
jgi:hypothetical protein